MKMNKILYVLYFCILTISMVQCDIPNVYEFCSALMSDRGNTHQACAGHCHGRPGKRGADGRRGIPGQKGDRGESGTTEELENRIRSLEDKVKKSLNIIPKLTYCGMGMKSRDIPDQAITSSSDSDYRHARWYARMDESAVFTSSSNGASVGAWCASTATSGQWIQVDFQRPRFVGGIVTQGRPFKYRWDYDQWVKTYKVSCGSSTSSLETISENGSDKIFVGNTDEDSKVINMFPQPLLCRFVRLYPLTWSNHPCMRMELIKGECHDLF